MTTKKTGIDFIKQAYLVGAISEDEYLEYIVAYLSALKIGYIEYHKYEDINGWLNRVNIVPLGVMNFFIFHNIYKHFNIEQLSNDYEFILAVVTTIVSTELISKLLHRKERSSSKEYLEKINYETEDLINSTLKTWFKNEKLVNKKSFNQDDIINIIDNYINKFEHELIDKLKSKDLNRKIAINENENLIIDDFIIKK